MIPGWWHSWCEANGLNPDRPERWPDAAQAAFLAEKLRRFSLHWKWMLALGQPTIIRHQSGRDELIRQVRRDLAEALAPCPARGPYEGSRVPADPKRADNRARVEPWDEVTMEVALAHVDAHPGAARLSVRTVKCLVWLEREFGARPGAVRVVGSDLVPSHAGARPSDAKAETPAGMATAHP